MSKRSAGDTPQNVHRASTKPLTPEDLLPPPGPIGGSADYVDFASVLRATPPHRLMVLPEGMDFAMTVEHSDDELVKWWLDTAREDINATAPKIREYGGDGPAEDLIAIGEELLRLRGQTVTTTAEAQEAGIYFYLRGKIGRWATAIREGRQVSDDTLLDIAFYAMMARRVRAVGAWPWPAKPDETFESTAQQVAAAQGAPPASRIMSWTYGKQADAETLADDGSWCGDGYWHRAHTWGVGPVRRVCGGVWNKALAVHGHIYCAIAHDSHPHQAHYHGEPADPMLCPGIESETTTS